TWPEIRNNLFRFCPCLSTRNFLPPSCPGDYQCPMRNPHFLVLTFSAGLLAGCATGPSGGDFRDNQRAQSFHRTLTRRIGYDYLLFLPKGYDAKAGKHWSLMLFLHGAGERGTNVWRVTVHGPPKLVKPTVEPANDETPE